MHLPRPALASLAMLAAIAGCSPAPGQIASGSPERPVVAEVIDGDTILVDFGPSAEPVRLLGVDTPETLDPNRPVQCYGAQATAFVEELIPPGTPLRVERDEQARDHFGRLLLYVFRADDDTFINAALIAQGYADISVFEPNTAYATTLGELHTSALTRGVGLWGVCGSADLALDPPQPGAGAD